MDDELILAFLEKDYEYILNRLRPLFLKNLQGVPRNLHDDFLQEYQILCYKIVSEADF